MRSAVSYGYTVTGPVSAAAGQKHHFIFLLAQDGL